ncbi:disintegrin and metalloproteinase domain-containing protein 9-like [Pelodytes ibericus]
MWKWQSQLALLWLLSWGHQVFGLPDGEIVFPERVVSREKRNLDPHNMVEWAEKLFYSIQTSNGTLLLKLKRNRGFVSGDFARYTYSSDVGLQALNHTHLRHSCFYRGEVEGVQDSILALSTCHGLSGIVHMEDMHYGIEPVKNSSQGEHLFFKLEEPSASSMCGVDEFETVTAHTLLPSYYQLRRKKRDVLATISYVELGIVVDNLRYKADGSNATAVEQEVINLVNIVDVMYDPLNIKIVLVSLVIWSGTNPIDVSQSSAGAVLGDFSNWRKNTAGLKRTDISHLLIGHDSFSGVLGMAFVGTVCSPNLGSAFSIFPPGSQPSGIATIFAHEVGHNLGMYHDDTTCGGNNIMRSTDSGGKTFSSCSANDFENLILKGGGTCLLNPPDPNSVLSLPVCGNNVVEKGEECDCGLPKDCTNPCCNAATCRLTSGSQCAQGLCCANCKFNVAGTVCRPISDPCDLPEYCNGTYGLCPPDVYIMNGYPCNNSYCYSGVCQNYNAQCKNLLGDGITKGVDDCFKVGNIRGDPAGNCGQIGIGCTIANSLCGKLMCTGQNPKTLLNATLYTFYVANAQTCYGVGFHLGPDVPDPGMVHDGTACGADMACLNHACVNASKLGYNCDTKVKCNDHGVCNNNGNCNCDYGWAPPFCIESGYGGSIDSGPTHIDTSLRDGLLIFFLLVLPILLVIAVMVIKRDAIRRWINRRKRRPREQSQPRPTAPKMTNNNRPNSSSGNQPERNFTDIFTISHYPPRRPPMPNRSPQPPVRPPPPRPPAPPQPRPAAPPQQNWNQYV